MKDPEPNPIGSSAKMSSRRRTVRLDAPGGLTISLSDKRINASVADISSGGLGLLCNLPLSRGTVYTVTLQYGQMDAVCQAKATHSRKIENGRWLVGLAFVGGQDIPLIERLIDAMTSQLIQFS